MSIIRKARANENVEIEVKVPLYLYSEDAEYKDYVNATPINVVENNSDSILSVLGGQQKLTDISGMEVLMLAFDGNKVFKDNVIIKGRTANWIVVEIAGEQYSVARTRVIFTKRD